MNSLLLTLFLILEYHGYNLPLGNFRGNKVFRVTPRTRREVEVLKNWVKNDSKVDAWKAPSAPGFSSDIHVENSNLQNATNLFKKHSMIYKEIVADIEGLLMEEAISNIKLSKARDFQYDKYNTWKDIKKELEKLSNMYPSRVTKFSVGKTYEGNEQMGLIVTNSDGGTKPVIWIDGGIHAREWISPATVMYFLKELITSNNTSVTNALQKYDFYILPVFNIDGYIYTHKSYKYRMWRKTRRPTGEGCYGTDPNRNFDSHFGGVETSNSPCNNNYHGGCPFSEIEVKNVADYLKRIGRRLKSYWNVHSYKQLILTPWAYSPFKSKDYPEIKRVGDVFVTEVKKRYGTIYKAGTPPDLLYAVSGSITDWVYEKLNVKYTYALELRDRGKYAFILPATQIIPSGEETTDAILAAVMAMK